jgi:hypothetical protein
LLLRPAAGSAQLLDPVCNGALHVKLTFQFRVARGLCFVKLAFQFLRSLSVIKLCCPSQSSTRSRERERLVSMEHCVVRNRIRCVWIHRAAHLSASPESISSGNAEFNATRPMVLGTRSQVCNGGIGGLVWICSAYGRKHIHCGLSIVWKFTAPAADVAAWNRSTLRRAVASSRRMRNRQGNHNPVFCLDPRPRTECDALLHIRSPELFHVPP